MSSGGQKHIDPKHDNLCGWYLPLNQTPKNYEGQ